MLIQLSQFMIGLPCMFATTVLSSHNLRYSDGVIRNLQVFTSFTSSVAERRVVSRSSVASTGPYIYFDSAFVGLIYMYSICAYMSRRESHYSSPLYYDFRPLSATL